jgi:hypothetical protein
MNFGLFALLGLLIAAFGIKVVAEIVRKRDQIFDRNLTMEDRHYISQAAYFVILPITVALHELGHAALIKLFGAEITSWGFYFFSGFVGYQGFVSEAQQILIAAAGVTVNLLLGIIAMAFVFLKRPPMRPAFNELLIQATVISVANALIFYPLLDFATDINGDFRQMYFGGVPWLSATIFAVHAGVLVGAFLASRNERVAARLAELTGLPPGVHRSLFGGLRFSPGPSSDRRASQISQVETTMLSAAKRVASGWPVPVQSWFLRVTTFSGVIVQWQRGPNPVAVCARLDQNAVFELLILPESADLAAAIVNGKVFERRNNLPSEDDLVLALRLAMEEADRRIPNATANASVIS